MIEYTGARPLLGPPTVGDGWLEVVNRTAAAIAETYPDVDIVEIKARDGRLRIHLDIPEGETVMTVSTEEAHVLAWAAGAIARAHEAPGALLDEGAAFDRYLPILRQLARRARHPVERLVEAAEVECAERCERCGVPARLWTLPDSTRQTTCDEHRPPGAVRTLPSLPPA
jgi:hypothetical protein